MVLVQIVTLLFIFSIFLLNFRTERRNSLLPDVSAAHLLPTGSRLCPHVKDGAEQRPSVCFDGSGEPVSGPFPSLGETHNAEK